ncbi:phosphate ABC transporter permease [Vibrio parahaemolyticus]|nr:phosphate ABC transporter permease [Vibrio parahaemolyticus]
MRLFLTNHGIGFDQRNSLVVGLAMGFAVIPTIFTIAEDAIFSVPKHLSDGSFSAWGDPLANLDLRRAPYGQPRYFLRHHDGAWTRGW